MKTRIGRPLSLLSHALVCALLLWGASVALAQAAAPYRIAYQLSMPRPATHLFEVQIEIETPAPVAAIDVQMPKWSPGRYAVYDFAKNVQEFNAASGVCPPVAKCERGPSLPITRVDTQTWSIQTRGATGVTVAYKVFADDLSGTFSQLDERHANYNGASVFAYVVGHKPDPVTLRIEPPPGWRVVNGWTEQTDQREWRFPNYDLLIDTPTEIAPNWTLDEFTVDGKSYRVVIHSFADERGQRKSLVRDIEKIVRAEIAMWGQPELDSYTFLMHFGDEKSGDGMEHLTSTQIITPGALGDQQGYEDALDTAAHEFFHVWNVKRLRPVELGPWDFTRPLNTRSLWIAEGITNYYGHLMQRRAGLWRDEHLYRALAGQIAAIENAPGSRLMSAEESSLLAPFIDGAPHAQETNLRQTTISYYIKGETLGLVLDLLIRGKTNGGRSLDDVLRRMYEEFYLQSSNSSYYLRGRGFTTDDFMRAASEVAGMDFTDFFARHVRGVEPPPYDEALAQVGLKIVKGEASSANQAGRAYRIEELKEASTPARERRRAWLRGRRQEQEAEGRSRRQ
ncbi:MAG: M61 family metallopeptidase [Pyrinomonadaceae bacterium]